MTGDLKEKIMKARLTRIESEIAEYILENIYEVCFMTASDLAKKLGTSNTSVNRTAKSLGYNVFSDMQKEMQEYVATKAGQTDDNLSLPPNRRIVRNGKGTAHEDLFFQMYNNTAAGIMQAVRKNPIEKLNSVVEMLAGSTTKYINGYRNTADLANKFGFLLELIVSNVVVASGESVSSMARLLDAGPEDCVIVISFNRYYRTACDIMELCHRQKTKTVLITDRITAPIAHLADVLLLAEVGSMSFFNSNVPAMFLIEAISAKLARYLGEEADKRLDVMEPYIRGTQIE